MSALSKWIEHRDHKLPAFVYGTAWKEDQTEICVTHALKAGFVGIDTANQRKHYYEIGVGKAIQAAWASGQCQRSDLFLQTKFTFQAGQDHRLPYDPQADFTTQVKQSFASSLEHLGTDYLDAYLIHGPSGHPGLSPADWEVWRTMETLQKSGKVKLIGVSNMNQGQLKELYEGAKIKPSIIQNRCYARTGWDAEIRSYCRQKGIIYQGFSLLTANRNEMALNSVETLAQKYKCTVPQLIFAFAIAVGMQPLTGTTNFEHMQMDLAAQAIELDPVDIEALT